ncbi:hypothetical protein scyTo_0020170, partial [Scyliorhinus torazame]|nr:hypothetical protein [Scyliorhinus torazame]
KPLKERGEGEVPDAAVRACTDRLRSFAEDVREGGALGSVSNSPPRDPFCAD